MHPGQKYLPDHWNRWIEAYALTNSGGQYRTLGASDFTQALKILFEDGSSATFHHAFAVKNSGLEELALFTEHCGYFVFHHHVIAKLEGICLETTAE
ncbi:MAG: hypothetical protein H6510_14670 [Acidobacteria bacterium]|nr:hypothetical protein [Acidobacteriota bacterium]MCB9399055.1 hypothetical protein [Acidobacteriota bacterium]